jgi:2-polyprenyl-6-methoxyphenol hydroxylase-like FAD-dependent oxidoreductase
MDIGCGYPVRFVLHFQVVPKLTILAVQDVPDPDDPATWSFQLQTTWHKDQDDVTSLANLKAKAATFAEPFRSANLWIPEGTPIFENKLSYWNPIPWDDRNGRIILAGDAAHSMTFRMYFYKVFCFYCSDSSLNSRRRKYSYLVHL